MAEQYGAEELIIVFGLNQVFNLRIMATTFKDGDPGYSGPLAGVALQLKSYHILELKEHIPADVWDTEIGLYELEIEEETQEQIKEAMARIRD